MGQKLTLARSLVSKSEKEKLLCLYTSFVNIAWRLDAMAFVFVILDVGAFA